jgi:hypothetical protein
MNVSCHVFILTWFWPHLVLGFLVNPVFTNTGQRHEVLMPVFPKASNSAVRRRWKPTAANLLELEENHQHRWLTGHSFVTRHCYLLWEHNTKNLRHSALRFFWEDKVTCHFHSHFLIPLERILSAPSFFFLFVWGLKPGPCPCWVHCPTVLHPQPLPFINQRW